MVTAIDQTPALIAIDLQKGTTRLSAAHAMLEEQR
jgi:hypothetical protein